MFPLVSLRDHRPGAVPRPGRAATRSPALLVGGFFLGIGGTAFAVGVPVRQRLVPARAARPGDRRLRRRHGRHRDQRADHGQARHGRRHGDPVRDHRGRAGRLRASSPRWCCATPRAAPCPTESLLRRLAAAARLPITWQACRRCTRSPSAATSPSRVYLPTYLKTAYGLDPGRRREPDGRLRRRSRWSCGRSAAGCPTGSARSRCSPARFAVVAVGAVVQASTPPLMPLGTIAFLAMAAALGAGSGATFALVAQAAPAAQGRLGHRRRRRGRWPRRLRPAAGHGRRLRPLRLVRASAWRCSPSCRRDSVLTVPACARSARSPASRASAAVGAPGTSSASVRMTAPAAPLERRTVTARRRRQRRDARAAPRRALGAGRPDRSGDDLDDGLVRHPPVLHPAEVSRRPAHAAQDRRPAGATRSTGTGGATTRSSAPPTA